MRKFYCLLATALCFLSAESARAQALDSAELAIQMGPRIATEIKGKLTGSARVAVMPFSNEDGVVDPSFGNTVKSLQGELISALKTANAGLVLDTRGIARGFRDTSTDPASLDISDPAATGTVLSTLKWDAVIMGQFGSTGPQALATSDDNVLKWSLTVIYQDGSFEQIDFDSSSNVVSPPSTDTPTGRFNVEILVDDQVLPFLTDAHEDSLYHNVKFLQIDPSMVGKEYQIRLTNHGSPETGYASQRVDETERVFGAAVLIDGVDSFARETGRTDPTTGDPLVDFAVVHPKNAYRWLLSQPGHVIRPDSSNAEGFSLPAATGAADHSTRTISGYQMSGQNAAAFTFAESGQGELTAELLGVTEDIGMIEVYFYARQLDGDRMLPSHRDNVAGLGTKPGRDIKNSVQRVNPKMHTAAVEVWRIYYRAAGSFPVPDDSLVPYTGN